MMYQVQLLHGTQPSACHAVKHIHQHTTEVMTVATVNWLGSKEPRNERGRYHASDYQITDNDDYTVLSK